MLLLHETGSKLAIYIMEKAILLPVLLILALHYLGVQSLRVCDQFPAGLDDALREDFEHDKVHAADKDHPALRKGHAETEYFRRAFCQECICSGCYVRKDVLYIKVYSLVPRLYSIAFFPWLVKM